MAGEVVFFVGAGFSLDSEGNSATRLVGRLLARFDALTALLAGRCLIPPPSRADCNRARELREALRATFHLDEVDGRFALPSNLEVLAREYYSFNDWITSAFADLLNMSKRIMPGARLVDRLSALEQHILHEYLGDHHPILTKMDLEKLLGLQHSRERGKALFLETMGFNDSQMMAGSPLATDLDTVIESYAGRLSARHQVLARLAREGLSAILLTTNFDLLLEGAYRLAGFSARRTDGSVAVAPSPLPPTTFQHLCRVASASQFFHHGDDRRSALLLKIHGCVESYRESRQRAERWSSYLPSLVFTYREVQNWREDSWSRDLLSTLLRTRTIVFCGYSGADPVLHDTIRTVYEDMAARRPSAGVGGRKRAALAPAFYVGAEGKTEFYGLEILRAASRAIGSEQDVTGHPNYLRFHLRKGTDQVPRFPSLDEIMRWLFHLTFRHRQRQALESDLGRIATILLGHPCSENERKTVLENFNQLLSKEEDIATGWDATVKSRAQFERRVAWTERFHVGLLREYALAEAALRSSGPGLAISWLRRFPWYYPTLDHADWTAWGALVEIALRRQIAALQGKTKRWAEDRPELVTTEGEHPTLLFSRVSQERTPIGLVIRLLAPGRRAQPARVKGVVRHLCIWNLDHGAIPWSRDRRQKKGEGMPDARTLWSWAHLPPSRLPDPHESFDVPTL